MSRRSLSSSCSACCSGSFTAACDVRGSRPSILESAMNQPASGTLTPIDILNQRFGRGVRGYAPAEVDEFLRRVSRDLETALAENAGLRERVASLEREMTQFRGMETTLRDSLVLAQRTADETRSAARLQADADLSAARAQAHEIDLRAREQLQELTAQVERLRQERRR